MIVLEINRNSINRALASPRCKQHSLRFKRSPSTSPTRCEPPCLSAEAWGWGGGGGIAASRQRQGRRENDTS